MRVAPVALALTATSALLALALLAGCSAPAATNPGPAASPAAPTVAEFTQDISADGCFEDVNLLLVDFAVAQAALPANWTAADANTVLGLPTNTGKAAFWLNGYVCDDAKAAGGKLQGAEIGIVVAPPRVVGGGAQEGASFHVYQLAQVTDSPRVAATLAGIGFPTIRGGVDTPGILASDAVAEGTLTVRNGTTPLYSFTGEAAAAGDSTATAHFWHENAAGLAVTRFAIHAVPTLKGPVSACTITGPWLQALTGVQACKPGDALTSLFPAQSWTGSLHWMPGARTAP